MTSRNLTKQLHLKQWAEDWKQQMNSGLSIKAWCQVQNISYNTFRSHISAVRSSYLENTFSAQASTVEEAPNGNLCISEVPKLDIAQVHLETKNSELAARQIDIHVEFKNVVLDISNSADLEHIGYVLGALLNVKF